MTAADAHRCSAGSITDCPADRVISDVQSVTCESKLYFQTAAKDGPCSRSLMLHYKTPTLLGHGDVWIFHFPSRRQLNVRCPRINAWVKHTRTLSGAGLIRNVKTSSITSGELRTLAEPHGATRANLDAPSSSVPEDRPIIKRHELPHVEAALKQMSTNLPN